jgi:hypothetical protein
LVRHFNPEVGGSFQDRSEFAVTFPHRVFLKPGWACPAERPPFTEAAHGTAAGKVLTTATPYQPGRFPGCGRQG